MNLVKALGLTALINECTTEMLIRDIAYGFEPDSQRELSWKEAQLGAVMQFLADESGTIPGQALETLMGLPVFPDTAGQLGFVKSAQASANTLGVYAVQPELRGALAVIDCPMLEATAQESLMPLLKRANINMAKVRTAIELLELKSKKQVPITDPATLAGLHQLLVDEKNDLKRRFPSQSRTGFEDGNPRLCGLKIWPTVTGGVVSADEAVDPGPLMELLEKGSREREQLQKRVLTPNATEQLGKLSPMLALCPAWSMAGDFITWFAKLGKPLAKQNKFISTPEKLRQVAELITRRKDITLADLEQLPVCDAAGCLQFGLLASADEETQELVSGLSMFSRLVHPNFVNFVVPGHGKVFKPVEIEEVLNAVLTELFLADEDRRRRFYNWLVTHEREVMSQDVCRKLIETKPCFMNAGGKLVVPGDLVVDPFNGSGTTGLAAMDLGMRYVGVDREEEFLALSRARMEEFSG